MELARLGNHDLLALPGQSSQAQELRLRLVHVHLHESYL